MRSIKKIHKSESRPIADLKTVSPMPTASVEHIDPYLFLNHHGPQVYAPNNNGLPFGPHPHRGMETLTFIVEGDIAHKDSGGHKSVIDAGGIQYMTAGRGLIHAETSSEKFLKEGGPLEILQLWINLPARLKMGEPKYIGKQKEEIPAISVADGKGTLNLIFGEYEGEKGAVAPSSPQFMSTLELQNGASFYAEVPKTHTIFLYVIRGRVQINGQQAKATELVEFAQDDEALQLIAEENSLLIFGHAEPFNEPIVAYGPFVMNSEKEIKEAYHDYHQGKFGVWQED